jgi:hypothetical protein
MHTILWLKNREGRDRSEDLGVDEKISLEWIVGKWDGKMSTGCIWPRIGASDELL